MSTSQITVLKARQLKQHESTSRVVSLLPEGFAEDMLKFDVRIPTKLWEAIVARQGMAVAAGDRMYTSVTLLTVRDIRDLSVPASIPIMISSRDTAGICVPDTVLINPVYEEFSRYGLTTRSITVWFDGKGAFNLGVEIQGLVGSESGRVVFDVRCLSNISMRPSTLAVSYIINV